MTPMKPYLTDNERWAAVQARDSAADGQFYYSVRTTGVAVTIFAKSFCRIANDTRISRQLS